MDVQELHDRGLKRRVDMFGREAVEKRTGALGEFGKPLQHIINAYAYGGPLRPSPCHQVSCHDCHDGGGRSPQ